MAHLQLPHSRAAKPPLSLRKHLLWLLLVKLVVIVVLRLVFFPSLQAQHSPADLYPPSSPAAVVKESS